MASPVTVLSPPQACWNQLVRHLQQWYHKPDIEVLDIALTVAASHYLTESDPIWLFVIGPSRSGKSSIIINGLSGLPKTHIISDLTPRTLVSAMQVGAGQQNPSLLHQIGSGILLFKDFTTFLSKRHDDQIEIASQLREIHDGKYARKTGTGHSPTWEGKIGIIAACTDALERAWSTQRELGERFIQVRWPRVGGSELAKVSGRQVGKERDILKTTRELCQTYAGLAKQLAPMNDHASTYLANLAEITARLRAQVVRDSRTRELIHVGHAEEPSSLYKSFAIICQTHAAMWSRPVGRAELKLADRIARDCISQARHNIIGNLPTDGSEIQRATLAERFKLPASALQYHAEEIAAHGLIKASQDANQLWYYRMTEELLALREEMSYALSEIPVTNQ